MHLIDNEDMCTVLAFGQHVPILPVVCSTGISPVPYPLRVLQYGQCSPAVILTLTCPNLNPPANSKCNYEMTKLDLCNEATR